MSHTCHAIGCQRSVHPRFLMCPPDWRLVPKDLQEAVWASYVPGQEVRKDPTTEYIDIAHQAILAVADAKGTPVPPHMRERWAAGSAEQDVESGETRRRRRAPVSPAW